MKSSWQQIEKGTITAMNEATLLDSLIFAITTLELEFKSKYLNFNYLKNNNKKTIRVETLESTQRKILIT